MLLICEIDENEKWRELTILDVIEKEVARGKKDLRIRCPVCKGPVRTHRSKTGKPQPHFEHRVKHLGCNHNKRFDGKLRNHPDALIKINSNISK